MRSLKFIIGLIALLFFQYTYSQVKFRWVDVGFVDSRTISAKIFAQNFGNITPIHNRYGTNYPFSQYDTNFLIEYDVITENNYADRHVKNIPSSITIETIIGTSLPMEQPVYDFYPTGSNKGEYWEIIFTVPRNIANIKISILNSTKEIDDTPIAIQNETNRKERFLSEKDSKLFNYQDLQPKHFQTIQTTIELMLLQYGEKIEKFKSHGNITFEVDKDGLTRHTVQADDSELRNFIEQNIEHLDLKMAEKYGYSVKAVASFDFRVEKGKFKAKYSNELELVKINYQNVSQSILDNVKRDIEHKGTYKVKYQYLFLNGYEVIGSGHHIKQIPKGAFIYWGIPALIGIALAIAS